MNDGLPSAAAWSSPITEPADEPGHDQTLLSDADCARIAAVASLAAADVECFGLNSTVDDRTGRRARDGGDRETRP